MPSTLVLVLVPTALPTTLFLPLLLSPSESAFPGPSVGDGAACDADEVVCFATGTTARASADDEVCAEEEEGLSSGVGEAKVESGVVCATTWFVVIGVSKVDVVVGSGVSEAYWVVSSCRGLDVCSVSLVVDICSVVDGGLFVSKGEIEWIVVGLWTVEDAGEVEL